MSRDRVEAEAWSYDGSIESLFILVDLALENGAAPTAVLRSDLTYGEPSLFDEPLAPRSSTELPADSKAASTAATRIRLRSDTLFDLCLRVWMSEEGVESELLFVAAGVGCSGDELAWDYARPQVRILRAACHRVDREIHRLQGLARFSPRDDGLYVAPLEPDHNIIAALVPHFREAFRRPELRPRRPAPRARLRIARRQTPRLRRRGRLSSPARALRGRGQPPLATVLPSHGEPRPPKPNSPTKFHALAILEIPS